MLTAVLVSLLAIYLAYMAKSNNSVIWLRASIGLITLFLAIGYNWGSDVAEYESIFYAINSYPNSLFEFDINSGFVDKGEIGWILINRLCQPIGFWGMRIVLCCFENYVIYRIIKEYVPIDVYWFAVFIYCFNNSLMVLGSSMMRQFLAMCIVALAWDILIRNFMLGNKYKGVLLYIGIVILASLFHQSAIITLPACLLVFAKLNFNRKSLLWYLLFAVLWFVVGYKLFINSAESLLVNYFEHYLSYDTEGRIGLGVVLNLLVFILMLASFDRFTHKEKLVCIFSCITMLIMPFIYKFEFISRISLYFTLLSVVAFPIFYRKSPKLYKMSLIPLVVILLYGYYTFFTRTFWSVAYSEYHTIFSVGGWR